MRLSVTICGITLPVPMCTLATIEFNQELKTLLDTRIFLNFFEVCIDGMKSQKCWILTILLRNLLSHINKNIKIVKKRFVSQF